MSEVSERIKKISKSHIFGYLKGVFLWCSRDASHTVRLTHLISRIVHFAKPSKIVISYELVEPTSFYSGLVIFIARTDIYTWYLNHGSARILLRLAIHLVANWEVAFLGTNRQDTRWYAGTEKQYYFSVKLFLRERPWPFWLRFTQSQVEGKHKALGSLRFT